MKNSLDKEWVNSMVDLTWFDEAVQDIKTSSQESHRNMRKLQEDVNLKAIEHERERNEATI